MNEKMYGSIHSTITYHAWLNHSPDSITIKNYTFDGENYGDGIYEDVSKVKAGHHNEQQRHRMRGKTDFTYLDAKEAENARLVDIMVMKNQKPYEIEQEKVARNGKTVWYNITVVPIIDGDGISRGVICTARDITKRVEAQQRAARLNKFLVRRIYSPMAAIMVIINNSPFGKSTHGRMLNEIFIRVQRLLNALS